MTVDPVAIDAVDVASTATVNPARLGQWLAHQNSEVQAEVLGEFALWLRGLGASEWRLQVAYIVTGFHDDCRTDIEEVLYEIATGSPITDAGVSE